MDDPKERGAEKPREYSAPVTRSQRFFKLAGMTASVVGRYARSRLEEAFSSKEEAARQRAEAHLLSGERIARTLGELKGAVMKVGQMASLASGVLPQELTAALSSLRREAPPMPFAVIAAQVRAELGAPPEALFDRFDPQPFAAASIGQVHRACLDGREVVVKVQYPGVDASCDSDLAHLKLALRASGLIPGKKQALDALFTELRSRLHEELDYCNEADNVRLFRQFHAAHPFMVIPEVVGERSAQRVLTLTYESGDSLEQAQTYPQEVRDLIGRRLLEMMLLQFFELQALHADPNPANFAFRPDGTLVVYDFGCVKKLLPTLVVTCASLVRHGLAEDYAGVDTILIELGARRPDAPPVDPDFYREWRQLLLPPFLPGTTFDFGRSTVHDEVLRHVPSALRRIQSFQPAKDVVMVDRVVAGHYWNLRQLGARAAVRELLDPWLERAGRTS